MPKACSDSVRIIRTIPPLLLRAWRYNKKVKTAYSHSLFTTNYESDKSPSSSLLSVTYCRRGVVRNLFAFRDCAAPFYVLSRGKHHRCETTIATIDDMASPVRDPASEQLNDYKKKLKVHACVCSYVFFLFL